MGRGIGQSEPLDLLYILPTLLLCLANPNHQFPASKTLDLVQKSGPQSPMKMWRDEGELPYNQSPSHSDQGDLGADEPITIIRYLDDLEEEPLPDLMSDIPDRQPGPIKGTMVIVYYLQLCLQKCDKPRSTCLYLCSNVLLSNFFF